MMAPRCNAHRERPTFPAACSVCHRISIEQDIVTRTVDALLAAGYALRVNDRESERPPVATRDRARVLAELMDTDDEYLEVFRELPEYGGWVRFVYGNDGWDVINDYTTNLEDALTQVNAYVNTLI